MKTQNAALCVQTEHLPPATPTLVTSPTPTISPTVSRTPAALIVIVTRLLVPRRWWAFEFLLHLGIRFAHFCISQMHFPEEVVSQSPVVVQPTEVGTAYIADLQLLVARGTRGI